MKKFAVVLSFATLTSSVLGMNNRNFQQWNEGTSFNTQDPHFNLSGFGNPKIEEYAKNEKPDNMVLVELKNISSADEASGFLSLLQSSIRNGNISKIATLLKKEPGVSVEYVLIYAAGYGMLNVVKWGIKQNANVNSIDVFGNTALTAAAKFNHFSVVKYLVEHGANVNVQNNDRDTPVQLAGKNRNREMVRFLLENRDKNKRDK